MSMILDFTILTCLLQTAVNLYNLLYNSSTIDSRVHRLCLCTLVSMVLLAAFLVNLTPPYIVYALIV